MSTAAAMGRPAMSDDLFARARARLTLVVPAGLNDPAVTPIRGDHDVDPVMRAIAEVRPIRPAAVLVPVVERDAPTVLLTQRAAHLPDHAGQISFPGGKIEAADASPLAAALREAEEEIGLERRFIDPIGYLDVYMTTLGYRIVPTVARIAPDFQLNLNRAEVDDTFEVPLAFLMAEENHKLHRREWRGMTRTVYAMPFGERYIWGVTAGILRNLYERIYRG
jgi:8-oxo-dGTP pyrophosphatase MutT (NUDIX family)